MKLPGAPAATLRLVGARAGRRVGEMSYFRKWLVLGVTIGVIAGFGAVLFYSALLLATHLFLFDLVGYQVPTPAGEGGLVGSAHYARPWALPLALGLGGLLSGLLVFTFAPEAEGHGTDAAIDAVNRNPRGIRLRAVIVKIVASALTIGSGGSGGREGPTAQISAGFGSLLARTLDLSPEDGRIAVSIGIGSGIGAIFSAPLGGAVLAAEIIYRDDFESAALLPGLICSSIAYAIFGAFEGFQPLFKVFGDYTFTQPIQLLWYAIIGVLGGFIGLAYARSFYGTVALTHRLALNPKFKPALAGVLVGLIGLVLPEVLGTGYGWVQRVLGPSLLSIPLYVVILLPLARIVATSLSIGSGGSGGVFGPGMVIGAFTGAAVWRLLAPIAPAVPHDPGPFVVVAMMACFGSISRAPLAVILMVAEMTASISELAPALVAVGLATLIVRRFDDSIYRAQPRNRDASPASRLQFGLPLAASVSVSQVVTAPRLVVASTTTCAAALALLRGAKVLGAPVVDESGVFLGVVDTAALERVEPARADTLPVGRVADPTAPSAPMLAPLSVALEALTQTGGRWVTVLRRDRTVAGVIAMRDVVAGYRRALSSTQGRMEQITASAMAFEEQVAADSTLRDRPLREIQLPPGVIVVSLQRDGNLAFADGDTVLRAGDLVSVLAPPDVGDSIRAAFAGPTPLPAASGSRRVRRVPPRPRRPARSTQRRGGR